ncbi:HPP family protein [Luteococcus sp.]|uniref:CBS domain-containing protein n=1 Tax=Luteococcus sp. TaxID=1969402 RepID=UPI00373605B8
MSTDKNASPRAIDPIPFTEDEYEKTENLQGFLATVKAGNPRRISVADLLRLVNYTYKTPYATQFIESKINERKFECRPELSEADRYGSVVISDPRDSTIRWDEPHGIPVSSLATTDGELTSLGKGDSVGKARALMVMHRFSQIPVLSNDHRELHGTVTWETLARHPHAKNVSQAMLPDGYVAASSDDLVDLVPVIIQREFIYVRASDRRIVSIITASDLAAAFEERTGPFMKLREIENRLRALLDQIDIPSLERHRNSVAVSSEFHGAASMTFQEYVNALGDEKIWSVLEFPMDRKTCTEILNQTGQARNDIAHFRPLTPSSQHPIDLSLNLLRSLME